MNLRKMEKILLLSFMSVYSMRLLNYRIEIILFRNRIDMQKAMIHLIFIAFFLLCTYPKKLWNRFNMKAFDSR